MLRKTGASPIGRAVLALREAKHRARHREDVLEGLAAVLRDEDVTALRVEMTNEHAVRIFAVDRSDEEGAVCGKAARIGSAITDV